jgi:F-type H+-transporting ATPase subunit epsilon
VETLKFEILTPNGLIFSGDIAMVTLPGEEGEFGVLPNHSSLTTMLQAGVIEIEKSDKSIESVVVNWGVVQVSEDQVTVLVDGAVAIRGESEGEIAKALDEAKDLIKSVSDSNVAIMSVSAKLESAAQKLI